MTSGDRVYRVMLGVLPRSLRREFGEDMVQLFRDRRREARGPFQLLRLWWRATSDLLHEARRSSGVAPDTGSHRRPDSWLADLVRDARHAVRGLMRSPALATVALISLALGIGVNTAVFSLVNAVFLRPLPYEGSGDLAHMRLRIVPLEGDPEDLNVWSYPYYSAFAAGVADTAVQSTAIYVADAMSLQGEDGAERVHAEYVSDSYMSLLGARPSLGRLFAPEETTPDAALPVIVLSDGAWRRHFGAEPGVVGRAVRIDVHDLQIIGVTQPGFDGLTSDVDFWLPLGMAGTMMYPEVLQEPHSYWMRVVARLEPGLSAQDATAVLAPAGDRMLEAAPSENYNAVRPVAVRLRDSVIDPAIRQPLALALGAVAFVLLIACGNVANLLLSRAVERRREVATRIAIGARRGRLIRQFLAEGLVLGLAGAVAGLALAGVVMSVLKPLMPRSSSWSAYAQVADQAVLDFPVLVFTLGLGVGSALFFSLVPAREVLGIDPGLRLESRGSTGGQRGRAVLVIVQLALAVVLLVGAGLMVRTMGNLTRVDTRASADRVLLARFQLPVGKYRPSTEFYLPVLERVRALPEVQAAAFATAAPLSGLAAFTFTGLEGEASEPSDLSAGRDIGLHVVSEDYLDVIEAALLAGRPFAESDGPDSPPVALVNSAAARQFWPDGSALGRRLSVGMWAGGAGWIEVVGIVDDVRYEGVTGEVEPQVYLSFRQVPRNSIYLAVRTHGAPQSVIPRLREVANAVDPQVPVYGLQMLTEVERTATAHSRFLTTLLVGLAAVAALLAAAGVQGMMVMTVAAQRRELGIRMALGADRRTIVLGVVTRGLVLAVAGGAIGLAAAAALRGVLRGQLFGVVPGDPVAIGATAGVLVLLAACATLLPARRAAATDPIRALRED